jgi:hypothetical protein
MIALASLRLPAIRLIVRRRGVGARTGDCEAEEKQRRKSHNKYVQFEGFAGNDLRKASPKLTDPRRS